MCVLPFSGTVMDETRMSAELRGGSLWIGPDKSTTPSCLQKIKRWTERIYEISNSGSILPDYALAPLSIDCPSPPRRHSLPRRQLSKYEIHV
jgi:hypothetical protein